MSWRITGTIAGSPASFEYLTAREARAARQLDQLSGDTRVVADVLDAIASRRLVAATPTSAEVPVTLDDPGSVFLVAAASFDREYAVTGKPGLRPEPVPAGAVA